VIYGTDYKSLFEKVMAIDPKIRFATIFDMGGKVLYGSHREGSKIFSLLKKVKNLSNLP